MITDSSPYFSVKHDFKVYLTAWPDNAPIPTEGELTLMLPLGLQLISDVKSLEADCLLQLRHLDDEAKTVVEYLKLQSKKVDLVLQHVLEREAHDGELHQGKFFGGSGIRITGTTQFDVGKQFKLTLHIKEELVALLCFAQVTDTQVIEATDVEPQTRYLTELEFSVITDTDVEQLVKASLSVQQKQLKQRKLAKKAT
ncbi:hypothetical protein [Shewanella nanhaiensis]|uniref:PilZ domain-containing protein n=1 Tax=Shewanella nanhaiensis TaxID=2864872 RepID=A0ABS7E1X5_9GAMM|nr:hypothetical protein [Shewanella nanhaiensis]MBW8183682.1 hypothetical protein [Shewanella nanhaiensis]